MNLLTLELHICVLILSNFHLKRQNTHYWSCFLCGFYIKVSIFRKKNLCKMNTNGNLIFQSILDPSLSAIVSRKLDIFPSVICRFSLFFFFCIAIDSCRKSFKHGKTEKLYNWKCKCNFRVHFHSRRHETEAAADV